MVIAGIDPGNVKSAICFIETSRNKPCGFETLLNMDMREKLKTLEIVEVFVFEKVACMGMAVGQTVFDTAEWTGRFIECVPKYCKIEFMKRIQVKMEICGNTRAKDKNIRQSLLDEYGYYGSGKTGLGTKSDPGPLYGIKADEWAALAVALAYKRRIDR